MGAKPRIIWTGSYKGEFEVSEMINEIIDYEKMDEVRALKVYCEYETAGTKIKGWMWNGLLVKEYRKDWAIDFTVSKSIYEEWSRILKEVWTDFYSYKFV